METSYRRSGVASGENRSTTSRNEWPLVDPVVCTRSALEIKRLAIVQIWRGLSKPRAREELHYSLSLEVYTLVRFGCRMWKPGADPAETRTKRKGGLHTCCPVIAQYTARDVTKHRHGADVGSASSGGTLAGLIIVCVAFASPIAGQDVECSECLSLQVDRGWILTNALPNLA